MSNSFLQLVQGDFTSKNFEVSLKSAVPIFLAYPEIIVPFKATLTDLEPYYNSQEDYEDTSRNIMLPKGVSPTPLIVIFTKVFEMVVKSVNSGESKIETLPKVSLKIDIAGAFTQFEVISPTEQQVLDFNNSKSKMFTFTGFSAVGKSDKLSDEQKHNLLLVDILTRKYNNSGLGGRR